MATNAIATQNPKQYPQENNLLKKLFFPSSQYLNGWNNLVSVMVNDMAAVTTDSHRMVIIFRCQQPSEQWAT